MEVKIERPNGDGFLVGTLENPCKSSRDLVLILHGMMGHRDYVYQKMLAKSLPYNSFRFDFHGNRDSDGEWDYANFQTDIGDLELVVAHLGRAGYRIWCIVGHSRGAIISYRWIMDHGRDLAYFVPVSCRFRMEKVWDRLPAMQASFDEHGYHIVKAKVAGEMVEKKVVPKDLETFAQWDTSRIAKDFPKTCQVLTIQGLADEIVPPHDAAILANILSAQGVDHTLHLIPEAGHNFLGKGQREQVVEEIVRWLSPQSRKERFLRLVEANGVGRLARWIHVDGVRNVRDVGGWSIPSKPGSWIRERVVFRSAGLGDISQGGMETLKSLGVQTVFDLRSKPEIQSEPPPHLEGISRVHVPVYKNEDASPAGLASRFMTYGSGVQGFTQVYMNILEAGKSAYKTIFDALIPQNGHVPPILVHCTAGKDRTGVFGMVFLNLLGISDDIIAQEYQLTECPGPGKGFGDGREFIARFVDLDDPEQAEMRENLKTIMSARAEAMLATLQTFEQEYGPQPARQYLLDCGLPADAIDSMVQFFTASEKEKGHMGWIKSVL